MLSPLQSFQAYIQMFSTWTVLS